MAERVKGKVWKVGSKYGEVGRLSTVKCEKCAKVFEK